MWPLRSSRQRSQVTTESGGDRGVNESFSMQLRALFGFLLLVLQLGVVKPHGRLGSLRSKRIATRPRATY